MRRHTSRAAQQRKSKLDSLERLESRQYLAAHIQGNPTIFATIQAAVDAAAPGATISVDAGTYSEMVNITKSLTLLGAQAGVDARSTTRGANETILNGTTVADGRSASFYVNANDVTIDGFTVQGNTSQDSALGAGMVIAPSRAGTHVLNDIFQNNVSGLFLANNSSTDPAIIYHNVFRNNNNDGEEGGRGIYTNGELSGGNLTNVVIDSNYFYNNRGANGTTGLEAAMAFEALTAGKQSNITITNNSMDDNGKATLFFNTVGVLLANNVVTYTLDQYSGTFRFEGNNQNVTIQNNTLYRNTGPAVAIDAKGVPGDNSGFVITNNNIYGNSIGWPDSTLGVASDGSVYDGVLDVRNNWWGNASGPSGDGPGTGDSVYGIGHVVNGGEWSVTPSGTELFSPWATSPIGNLRSPYFGLPMTGSALVQAENYDHGGEGVAFHDLDDSNTGGQYRNGTGVDIQTTTDTGGGYNVTSAKAGEWIGYTVALDTAGLYNLNFRVATSQTTGGVFHVLVDGVNATGAMTVPGTGNNQTWTTITKTGVNLSAGVHDVRVVFDTNGSAGVVGNLNWMQFVNTTPPPVPAAPSNLVVTNRSFSSVSLAWSDNSSNETGFTIERKAGIDGTWTPVGSALGNSISYIDNTAAPGTFYFYRVRANSSSGDSLNSNETSVTTTTASAVTYLSDLPFLGTPTNGWGPVERDMNVGGSGAGDGTTIVLNGVSYAKGLGTNAVSDISFDLGGAFKTFITDVGVDDTQKFDGSVQFQVFADNVLIFDSGVMGPDSPTQSVARDVSGVHTLRLLVGDGGDGPDFDWADWAGARLTTQSAQLSAPTNLVASALSPTQVKLTWTDNSIGETGTRIERSTNGIDFTEIATAPADATSFIDTTASPGGSYTYRVRATSGGSNSDYSNTYSTTTPSLPPITYISDMQWDSSTNGWGPVERDMNVGGQSAGDGTTLKLNGTTYTKGLGTNSPSTVTVTLNGSYGWFLSDVGIDDHQTTNGSVTFQVWADNVKIYDSGLMKPTTATQSLTLSMAGVKQLQLVVTDGGDGNAYDWADWANARLLAPGALPTPPAAPTSLAANVSGSSVALSWVDNASNEDNYLVERSTDNVNFSQIASLPANSITYTDATVAGGITYYYRVRASNSAGPSGYSNVANNVVNAIPAPWTQADVGSVGSASGSASYSNGTFLVRGGGSSTGGFTAKSDVFHYVYQSKSGNFTITSHVVKVQNTNSAAKAGIMVRNGTAANAVFVGLFVTPGKGVVFVRRTSAGGGVTTTTVNAITAPVYLRLTRSGNTFTAYRSSDNITWTTIGTASVTMPTAVTTGLVVSSMLSGTLNTSTFDNVSIA